MCCVKDDIFDGKIRAELLGFSQASDSRDAVMPIGIDKAKV